MKQYIDLIENENRDVLIISGEGEQESFELYTGKRSIRAIKSRLTCERCGGDRWARAEIFSHYPHNGGDAFINLETGDYRSYDNYLNLLYMQSLRNLGKRK